VAATAAAAAEVTYCLRHVTTLLWDEDVRQRCILSLPFTQKTKKLPWQLRKQPGILL
jgi:hypothetical protein